VEGNAFFWRLAKRCENRLALVGLSSLCIPMKSLLVAVSLALGFAFGGCATHVKSTVVNTARNPAPTEKFAGFSRFELSPIALTAPYAGQEANEAALKKIQQNADLRLKPLLASWNQVGSAKPARTLSIEPTITEIKFISGGKRFLAGAMAGSSIVVLKARITEKETGRLVGEPEFYARAAAMSGAWSIGGADNAMLIRIANRLSDYIVANYDAAVGGVTGADVVEE